MERVIDASVGEEVETEYTTLCANELYDEALRLNKEERMGYWTIAKELGISPATVKYWLKQRKGSSQRRLRKIQWEKLQQKVNAYSKKQQSKKRAFSIKSLKRRKIEKPKSLKYEEEIRKEIFERLREHGCEAIKTNDFDVVTSINGVGYGVEIKRYNGRSGRIYFHVNQVKKQRSISAILKLKTILVFDENGEIYVEEDYLNHLVNEAIPYVNSETKILIDDWLKLFG